MAEDKKILFVCVENAGRSQIAEGFFRKYAKKFEVVSAGTEPKSKLNPVVVEAMNRYLDESIRYRRRNVKRRYIIQHEAHRMANILLAETGAKRPDWLEIKEF